MGGIRANTDAHHLKPVDSSINSIRSNKDFDNGGEIVFNGDEETNCFVSEFTFEPRDEVKGDIARMIFYMDVRYEGGGLEPDLEVVDYISLQENYPSPEMGKLSTLLQWHIDDPPDDFERNRNEVIYSWQGNRNPFIDRPEFVDYIYSEDSEINTVSIQSITIDQIDSSDDFTFNLSFNSLLECSEEEFVTVSYGNNWFNIENESFFLLDDDIYSVQIDNYLDNMLCYIITFSQCDQEFNYYGSIQLFESLSLKGILDFSVPSGGVDGKGIHLVANNDIPDLSLYGIGIANNGDGSDGQEYTFPSTSIS